MRTEKKTHNINVGLIGFGNVGQGVFKILSENKEAIESRVACKLNVKTVVVRNVKSYESFNLGDVNFSTDVSDILDDPEIDVVVEVIGGDFPAYDYICDALKKGKHVVTANKEVIAKHKKIFFELAKKHHADIYFEASVGGGIPIIRSFKVGYSANQIQSVYGILNGTTNYILTKIQEDEKSFDEVLKEAQALGFAEADPVMDVSGLDAAYKLIILADVAFKADIQLDDVVYEGIEKVSLADVSYASEMGYVIKLLATGRYIDDENMSFKVFPTMVPHTHPLASVRNEFNAIFSVGNAMGESMIYGKGAGSFPTGSAVVSDILDIAFDANHRKQRSYRNLELEYQKIKVVAIQDTYSKFYIRMFLSDHCGVLEKIMHIFGKNQVSILKMLQKEKGVAQSDMVLVTHKVLEKNMRQSLIELQELDEVETIGSVIRVGLDEVHPRGLFGV